MKLKYEIALAISGTLLIVVPVLFWRRAPQSVKSFFTAVTAPLNLAIFRIVFFFLVLFSFSIHETAWFGSLPPELRFPPQGLQFVLAYVPINETIAWYASGALVIACVACILGLFTRTSIIICLGLSLYVLGLPQVFGKMNHYHHLIWFMAILAVSPCADVLSIDAIFKSWKNADRGVTDPPGPSQIYALPLRFVWLLMGVIYFSAGFWKVWTGGYRWAWSDNPRNLMYNKWMELSGWTPLFRIDHYPLLYKLSAVATLAFEFSFVVLIFFATVRWLAPLGGLAFHNMTNLFMRISFWNLQGCYVTFVDWKALFNAAGKRLFKSEMYVVYDGNCKLCRRTIASFRVFDLLDRVTYVNALNRTDRQRHNLGWLDEDALMQEMHVVTGKKVWRGFSSYRAWLSRMPLFWPLLPVVYVWPMTRLGKHFYGQVAGSRTCNIAREMVTRHAVAKKLWRPTAAMGALLVYVATLSAVGKVQTWPFACYPTFEDLDKPEVSVLTIDAEDPKGEVTELRAIQRTTLGRFAPERLMGLQNRLVGITDQAERAERLQAFWRLWIREDPSFANTTTVRFYRDTVSSIPGDQQVIKRELIYQLVSDSRLVAVHD
ncbi:MAG TPA: DCC1-like thiol-disulfide oxidoreductase family protein [Pyrinomonadaceae bacterium]